MFRRLSISSFRFFLAGKGLSFHTTGKYLGEALEEMDEKRLNYPD